MNKKAFKKLSISSETVRRLVSDELAAAEGGKLAAPCTEWRTNCSTDTRIKCITTPPYQSCGDWCK